MISPGDPRHGTKRGYGMGCRRPNCPLPKLSDCTHASMIEQEKRRAGILPGLMPNIGTLRRIQALKAIGWSGAALAAKLGYSDRTALNHLTRYATVEYATWAKVCALYDELSMIPGPSNRTKIMAAKAGFAVPLAWDDDAIDNPSAKPYKPRRKGADPELHEIDPVIVDRAMNGERVKANPAERAEIVRRWLASGRSRNALEAAQGWNTTRDNRKSAAA